MDKATFNLVIVGVGGQGTLLASKILGRLALMENLGVKVSEVHGMSQRGGSVITHVRVGDQVKSPIVSLGEADYLISFEALEAARSAAFLKDDGVVIVNSQEILPMPVITGAASYPAAPLDGFGGCKLISVDALALAISAGNQRALNLVLLGILSKYLPFEERVWNQAIAACVPRKTLEVNLKAFALGREQAA
ncbi:MAG: indolepyruvate oxidoreductase subunit beta [Clostridiales bacterium]|nr:indolepyruvate oxidoreductase subunit beta [Clostridiales bacterium]